MNGIEEAPQLKIATRDDWDIKEMPEKRDTFKLERVSTEEQIFVLRRGNIPQEMTHIQRLSCS